MKKIFFTLGLVTLFTGYLFGQAASGGFQYVTTNVITVASQAPTNKILHGANGLTSSNKTWFISEIEVGSLAAAHGPATVTLYDFGGQRMEDGGTTVITNSQTNNAYADYARYRTNWSVTNVTSTGVTNIWTNIGYYTISNYFPGKTSAPPVVFAYTLPTSAASASATFEDLEIVTVQGLSCQVSSNAYIKFKYKEIFSPTRP